MKNNFNYILIFLINFLMAFPDCEFGDPEWENSFIPNNYEFSATLANASILIDGIDMSNGKLFAFVEDEIRGADVDGASFFPPTGANIWEVSLYSNLLVGENIIFKYYDNENDLVIELSESIIFESNAIFGSSAFDPFNLTGINPIDECGICNGPGFTHECENGILVCDVIDCEQQGTNYFGDIPSNTGVSELIILSNLITTLDEGDQIGVFDTQGIISDDCSNTIDEILVGSGEWSNEQLEIVAISSIDYCDFGGIERPGFVEGNAITLRVWDVSEQVEYETILTLEQGSYNFEETSFVVISDIDLISSQFPAPDLFNFVISTGTAYYYIDDIYINNALINEDDWVAAFNGDVCVGARKWDVDMCTNSICDIAIMGVNSLDSDTDGYMQNGDVPIFKIYDSSTDTYYNANPSENHEWETGGIFTIDNLNNSDYYCEDSPSCMGCFEENACNYNADAIIEGTCHYLELDLIYPSNNSIIEILNEEQLDEEIIFSWTGVDESCLGSIQYYFNLYNQNFDLILSEQTFDNFLNISYDLLSLDFGGINSYSWNISIGDLTSDAYFFGVNTNTLTSYNQNNIQSFYLYDNYPNPFNPITNINFDIIDYSLIKINIYDINGTKVDNLVENYFLPGSYNIQWDAGDYTSGIYFYQMESDYIILRKKMILIK